MIDRETALQWAKDAGGQYTLTDCEIWCTVFETEHLQALITRAQKEAPDLEELVKVLQEAVDGMGGSYALWAPKALAVLAKHGVKYG